MVFAKHFTYRGQDSTEYGLVLCPFDSASLNDVDVSVMASSEVEIPHSFFRPIYDVYYSEMIGFSICFMQLKCGEPYYDDFRYTRSQTRELLKWLSVRKYDWIHFYDDDVVDVCYYCYPERITQKKLGKDVIGYQVDFKTNSPFGWSEPIEKSFSITGANQQMIIDVPTDDDSYIYPYVEITKNGRGNIEIRNTSDKDKINRTDYYPTTISNCINGEKIIMDCQNKIITSSDTVNHKFFTKDFNFHFLRFVPKANIYTVNGNCDIKIKYRTAIKIGEY